MLRWGSTWWILRSYPGHCPPTTGSSAQNIRRSLISVSRINRRTFIQSLFHETENATPRGNNEP